MTFEGISTVDNISNKESQEKEGPDYLSEVVSLSKLPAKPFEEKVSENPKIIEKDLVNSFDELVQNPTSYRHLHWAFAGKVIDRLNNTGAGNQIIEKLIKNVDEEEKKFFLTTNILFSIANDLENYRLERPTFTKLVDRVYKPKILNIVKEVKDDEQQSYFARIIASNINNWYTSGRTTNLPSFGKIAKYEDKKISRDYIINSNSELKNINDNNVKHNGKIDFLKPLQAYSENKSKYDIYSFSLLQINFVRKVIEDSLQVRLEDLTLLEQFHALNFLKSKTEVEINNVKKFGKKFGSTGFRTFLSIEHGGKEMGDKILALGEKLPQESANLLFKKYSEYIDAVNNVEEVIKKEYKLPPSPELINKTKESLLIKGRNLLLAQNQKLQDGEFTEEKFTESLENAKVAIDMYKNIFRIAKENNPNTSFEDFVGLAPEQITSNDQIKDEDISKIFKTIDKNYPNEELRKAVKESFQNALQSNSTVFNFLRRDENIVALDRIDQREDGTLYFGSFNVDPDYCSSKIGAAFFEATVSPLMKDKIIRADCSSLQPIASYYIESGFVANSLYDYKGEPSFSLESNPNKKFTSKNLTKLQLMEFSIKEENPEGLIIKSAQSQKEATENKIPEGYCLTRYFFDKNTNKWLTVFEKSN